MEVGQAAVGPIYPPWRPELNQAGIAAAKGDPGPGLCPFGPDVSALRAAMIPAQVASPSRRWLAAVWAVDS
jgi:hypothetical protein